MREVSVSQNEFKKRGRPLKKDKKKIFSLKLKPSLIEKLREVSDKSGVKMTHIIENFIISI